MDTDILEHEDLQRLYALRERLRIVAVRKLAECEGLAMPQSALEGLRQIRLIAATDRLLVQVFCPPPRRRRAAARTTAPKDFDAKPSEPPPPSPDLPPGPDLPPSRDLPPSILSAQNAVLVRVSDHLDSLTRKLAKWANIWPDGALFDPTESDWRPHASLTPLCLDFQLDDEDGQTRALAGELLTRCNAIAREHARVYGHGFDLKPYCADAPDYFSLSVNLGSNIQRRADDEAAAPAGLPWWIVCRRPSPS